MPLVSTILGFFGLNKYLIAGGVVAILAVGSFAGLKMYQLSQAELRIEQQKIQIVSLQSLTETQKQTIDLKDKALAAVEERNIEIAAEREDLEQKLKVIADAPKEDDGPVAPVLRRALGG